ncbi:beta-N-acetylhexosaminidase [Microbacterium sp. RD1]|uniref:beta-N-acetylhexosaminidase n=1 Tax=Microbacterium sp. RD1 TaxID=3457313 RepID=UPI003FA52C56
MIPPPLVPYPAAVRVCSDGPFVLAGSTVSGDADAAAELSRLLTARTGEATAAGDERTIRLERGAGAPESYALAVDAASVVVRGADAAGLFYGVQTLAQLAVHEDGRWILPAIEVDDAPRFAYRGAMLDVARHFFAVDDVTAYIDRISSLKINHLHLHLSDDQGWRLELRARPELTARASGSAVDGDPGGFYTREDYARIVDYAAARHVTVVPEIDVPGHTHAVGLAYPAIAADPVLSDELRAAGGVPVAGRHYPGIAVGFSSLRIDEERTYEFLADVFGELAALTPGPFLHLGGDEALGTTSEDYATFVSRAVDIVAATGKTPLVWHEAAAVPGLPVDVVAQYWAYTRPSADPGREQWQADAVAAAERAASVILSPADVAYLDMKPEPGFRIGLEWAEGPTSVAAAYGWEPRDVVASLGDDDILGVEAPLWSETVRTLADIDALAFPRVAAVAEIAWSPAPDASTERTWDSFRDRVARLGGLWSALGIGYHRSREIPWR